MKAGDKVWLETKHFGKVPTRIHSVINTDEGIRYKVYLQQVPIIVKRSKLKKR